VAAVTPKFAYSVADAAKAISISRAGFYELINRGEIEVIHLGRRVLVPTAAIARLLGIAPSDLVGSAEPSAGGPPSETTDGFRQAAAHGFAASIAGATQTDLDEATFVVTVRRVKAGEKLRVESSRW